MKRTSAADTGRFRPAAGGWRKLRKPPAQLLRLADLLPTRLSAAAAVAAARLPLYHTAAILTCEASLLLAAFVVPPGPIALLSRNTNNH